MLTWHFTSENYPKDKFQVEETTLAATWWPATYCDEWCGEHQSGSFPGNWLTDT